MPFDENKQETRWGERKITVCKSFLTPQPMQPGFIYLFIYLFD